MHGIFFLCLDLSRKLRGFCVGNSGFCFRSILYFRLGFGFLALIFESYPVIGKKLVISQHYRLDRHRFVGWNVVFEVHALLGRFGFFRAAFCVLV